MPSSKNTVADDVRKIAMKGAMDIEIVDQRSFDQACFSDRQSDFSLGDLAIWQQSMSSIALLNGYDDSYVYFIPEWEWKRKQANFRRRQKRKSLRSA